MKLGSIAAIGLSVIAAATIGLSPLSGASTRNPLSSNPVANVAPHPNFLSSGPCHQTSGHGFSCANPCFTSVNGRVKVLPYNNSHACTTTILAAIDNARSSEGIGPMVLPSNWYALSTPEQMYVVTNLERTARGLPPFRGLVRTLNHSAELGAKRNIDPWRVTGMAQRGFTSILADASPSPLAADYVWMYNDGWGGSLQRTANVDCTSAQATGCWGHRRNILGNYIGPYCHNCEMGAAYVGHKSQGIYAEIFVRPLRRPVATSFNWKHDVAPYLTTAPTTTTTSAN